jgi:hypothetical protein
MDIEEIKAFAEEREQFVFVDSNDARVEAGYDIVSGVDPSTGEPVVYRDTQTATASNNPANAYRLTFRQPFRNVVSVEVVEAYLPAPPLLTESKYDTTLPNYDPLRFVTIQVPEIEEHMWRNKRDINWPYGMARVCWDGLADRDFVVHRRPFLTPRKFHPIEKLGHMTITFTKNSTNEYVRFKGYHHQILFSILTMEPKTVSPSSFPLAPMYDPLNRTGGYVRATAMTVKEDESDSDI